MLRRVRLHGTDRPRNTVHGETREHTRRDNFEQFGNSLVTNRFEAIVLRASTGYFTRVVLKQRYNPSAGDYGL